MIQKTKEQIKRSLIVKHVFSTNIKRRHDSFFSLFRFPFFNYLSLTNPTQPDYGIINLIIFLRFPLFGFYSGEKKTDKNFRSVLILDGEKHWSPLFTDKLFATILRNNLKTY